MQPKTDLSNPASGGGYIPYFYESGLFLSDNEPPGRVRQQPVSQSYASYDFSSEQHPWLPSRQPQTVEQIISSGYFAVPGGEPETAIISDKKQTSSTASRRGTCRPWRNCFLVTANACGRSFISV